MSKEQINLPKTAFSMKANLPVKEPDLIKYWTNINLYKQLRVKSKGQKKFVLHDGPPYANGNIHMGTALNKILKDIVTKFHQMSGQDSVYVPGWDCHGLPIEWKIEEQYKKKKKDKDEVPIKDFRQECREFANKWIDIQKKSFTRLFVLADWSKPYLTMDFESEAIILEEFSKLFFNGYIYQGSKPVMWSPVEKTALAEAEIEYKDIKSTSIYTAFRIKDSKDPLLKNASIMIWTTTPWTIPGNRAIAYGKNIKYCLFEIKKSENKNLIESKFIVAEALLKTVCDYCKILDFKTIQTFDGVKFNGTICIHPFYDYGYQYDIPLLEGDFVEDTEGTGLVHIAPCYGEDDYNLAKRYEIDIKDIVEGTFKKAYAYFHFHPSVNITKCKFKTAMFLFQNLEIKKNFRFIHKILNSMIF